MEYLDIVDENGEPTGEIISRREAHEKGVRHRTSHVWILRKKEGRLQILLQKRSQNKDSFPGCFDISSAGHIPAGQDYVTSALRELKEELGYTATPDQLVYCGKRLFHFEREFHNRGFSDNQVSSVFALWLDQDEDAFILQKEEVESVRWFDFEECKKAVAEHSIPNCIFPEELEMLPQKEEGNKKMTIEELREQLKTADVAQMERLTRENPEQAKQVFDYNIVLIGFMGCGKSTISAYLRDVFYMEVIEMDQRIVEQEGMPISEIFEKKGEPYFRDLETNLLISLQQQKNVVISCGGGVPMRDRNVVEMKKNGKVVLLRAQPETVFERVKDDHSRPLLEQTKTVEHIAELMEQRREKYEAAAEYFVDTDGKTSAEIGCEIVQKLLK